MQMRSDGLNPLRMSPKQERRATSPQAKSKGRGPWMARVRSIGNVEIPQAELPSACERTGLDVLSRADLMQRGFLAILKVGED
ncbi:MAG TPA: hypothetical protein PKL14_03710 [Holophaga sp.]|jgi:hypothetical protein|nr:hypothetical protein [Holophaga sp.]